MPNNLYYIRRDKLKQSTLDFSNKSSFTVRYLVDIERGKAVPKLEEVEALAQLYNITGQNLLSYILDYIGVRCAQCQTKYLKSELYGCDVCKALVCEDCSEPDMDSETLYVKCSKCKGRTAQ